MTADDVSRQGRSRTSDEEGGVSVVSRLHCTRLWRCSAWFYGAHQDDCRGDWLRERVNVQRRYCLLFGWRLW